MLRDVIPLPEEALFAGQAQDNLPVFLNLKDPTAGSILIVGEAGAGKTNFLRVLAYSAIATHSVEEIQFAVFTNEPGEWDDLCDQPLCFGIFPICRNETAKFIRSLIGWRAQHDMLKPVLLLIDGIEALDQESGASLYKALADGPTQRVWPIATLDPGRCQNIHAWLKVFQTHVFGHAHLEHNSSGCVDMPRFSLDRIVKGVQFCLKDGREWIKFWVPTATIAPCGEG